MGYVLIEEDYSLTDGLYMTVITITTVGYREVHELSDQGRQFTILLLLCSVLTAGYSVTTLISFIPKLIGSFSWLERILGKE